MKQSKTVFPLALPKPMHKALKERALQLDRSLSSIIRSMLIDYLLTPVHAVRNGVVVEQTDFRPYATIECERSVPSQITLAVITGAPALLHVELDVSEPAETFVWQTLDALQQRLSKIGSSEFPFFGKPVGVVVNYEPENAIRFDLAGNVIGFLDHAIRVDPGSIEIGEPVDQGGERGT